MGVTNTLQLVLLGSACIFHAAHACRGYRDACSSAGEGCYAIMSSCPTKPPYGYDYPQTPAGYWEFLGAGPGIGPCSSGGAVCNIFGCNCDSCDCGRRLEESNECDDFNSYMSMTDDEKVAHLGAFHCKSAAALSDIHTRVETFIDSSGDNNGALTCDEFNAAYHDATSLELCEQGFIEGHAKRFQSEMTCGEVKAAYKANECCGNPSKTWEGMSRRLMPEVLKQEAPSDASLMAQIKLTLQERKQADEAGAANLAQSIMAITEKYTGPHKF